MGRGGVFETVKVDWDRTVVHVPCHAQVERERTSIQVTNSLWLRQASLHYLVIMLCS